MSRDKARNLGWQGACLVAITYAYFLIFAQFAFLKRLASLGIADAHLKIVMAAMGAGGVLLSLLTPRLSVWPSPQSRLRTGLAISAAAAFLANLPLNLPGALALAFLIGAGPGLLTVTLATTLRLWTGNRNPLFAAGMGTGIGYLICNLPFFFTAAPETQATTAGVFCLAGIAITFFPSPDQFETPDLPLSLAVTFPRALSGFTALVFLDSAAFFIIQNTPALKAETWQGSLHLWTNGVLHFAAALFSAWWLQRKGVAPVLMAAFGALAAACLLLLDPGRAPLASVLYPIGVSLYSVALVAYPSLLAPAATPEERGKIAGWIYAIAGWMGSAIGIGTARNLTYIPPLCVAAAGVVILLPQLAPLLRRRTRELGLTALALLAAFFAGRILTHASPEPSQIERGWQVYISEGCISCHSQYVRPNSADVLMWGPVETIEEIRTQRPPLIGNRRQGPDLSQVGARRSPLWLKAHFYNPAQVSGSSIMPSYGFLFRDQRGNDLIAYLESLHTSSATQHDAEALLWQPAPAAVAAANPFTGEELYRRDCANCHDAYGATRLTWQPYFKRLPPDLIRGPYFTLSPSASPEQNELRIAQIAKFGIPGTDMPGHEYLSDGDIASLSLWLSQAITQSNRQP